MRSEGGGGEFLSKNFSRSFKKSFKPWMVGPLKFLTALDRAQPQTTFFEAAWIRAKVGAGEGKANALGGQCAGALAGLAHLRGFKGRKG